MVVCEQTIMDRRRSGSDMCENIRPGTGSVIGSKRSGSKFDQNRVGGSD